MDWQAFEDFINTDSRCASYLATYIDDLLKSGLRGMAEDQVRSGLGVGCMLELRLPLGRFQWSEGYFYWWCTLCGSPTRAESTPVSVNSLLKSKLYPIGLGLTSLCIGGGLLAPAVGANSPAKIRAAQTSIRAATSWLAWKSAVTFSCLLFVTPGRLSVDSIASGVRLDP